MNKYFLISYQNEKRDNFQLEVPTREEAETKAEQLQDEGYINIIIEGIRE